ncbi:hypothetical protein RBA41_28300 [Massilia sp. CCM 9210]|uniref:hypothetical protein n=1 Tax=Massilia scottii TaxID=3057166 RepID=UPI002796B939|nr:hypothetical protein [Massilia sp. CCM 9210]MDQ1817212.1 hypothetical protein [Massilia sp. CCM 9210]
MRELTITVHDIAIDGLPPPLYPGDTAPWGYPGSRVAFLFEDTIVTGFPMRLAHAPSCWGAEQEDGSVRLYAGITHWVELSESPRQMAMYPGPTAGAGGGHARVHTHQPPAAIA